MTSGGQPQSDWWSTEGAGIDKAAILHALDKVTTSPLFADSQRMARFLRFAVEHVLEGNHGRLKEIVIGSEVFDRGPAYDPRLDPIVRVEARRLRSKLQAYYESEGASDPVIIDLPKGTYQPVFRTHAQAAPDTQSVTKPALANPAIVILPFTNLNAEPDQQYFSDGLTEELIHALTRIPDLRVIAWNTAAQFRADQDLATIRERLNVSYALRGAVRRTAQRLRITAQLIDAATGQYLWSETYNREIVDVFLIQEQIATTIVGALELHLGQAPRTPQAPSCIECYKLCLQGRFHANSRTHEGLRRAVVCFTQALALDDTSALAHAGIADTYTLLTAYGFMRPADAMEIARAAAEKAVAFDPDSAEAHKSLAWIRSHYEWRWAEAGYLHRRALELSPGYAEARHWYAVDYLAMLGRIDEAVPHLQLACDLDPLSLVNREGKGYLMMLARRYDEAIEHYRNLLEFDPSFYKASSGIGRVYIQCGRYAEAIQVLQRARTLAPDVPNIVGALGQAYALNGQNAEARATLAELERLDDDCYAPCISFAMIHLGLGDYEKALDALESSAVLRDLSLATINVHPAYDPVRTHPRFRKLLERIGFTVS